jgi:TonB-dependent SusC/RagA subfamily outer membrane receptor
MRKILFLLFIITGWNLSVNSQGVHAIHGTIKDATTGEPVSNATITTLVSKKAVVSSQNGTFNIMIAKADTLLISHIGYIEKKVAVESDLSITVLLQQKDVLLGNLTINTGYQQLKPNEVNGSYVVIDNKTLNLQTGGNILQRLNGVTSSVLFNVGKQNNNPQNNTNISIRGLSTINGPLDPLIVVDNFIYDGNINNINPNDVESVTVLKDAAASSIWGARAGNGVIVITLKKGKLNQPLQVDFNTDLIMTDKPDLYYQPSISTDDFIDLEQTLYGKGFYKKLFTNSSHPAISPAVQIFQDTKNGLISSNDSMTKINILKQTDSRNQFTKYYYQKGLAQQYALNLHGGSSNIAWLISGTYDKAIGNLRAKNDRINFRFENTYTPLKGMRIDAAVYYTSSHNISGLSGYTSVTSLNGKTQIPYLSLTNSVGNSVAVPSYYNVNYIDTLGGGKLMDWNYYPVEDYKHNETKTNTEEILGNLNLSYAVAKGISLNFLYQYEKQRTETNIVSDTSSYYARNLINSFSQVDEVTGIVNYIIPRGGILNNSSANQYAYNFRRANKCGQEIWLSST